MTLEQNAYFQMFAAVTATVDAHRDAWESFAPFAGPYRAFRERNGSDAEAALARQASPSGGTTDDKAQHLKELEALLLQIAHSLVLHATLHREPQLAADARTGASALSKMADKALSGQAVALQQLARTVPAKQRAAVRLTEALLQHAAGAHEQFATAIGAPRHRQIESARGTSDLAALLDTQRETLAELDAAAAVLQYQHPEFYTEYTAARALTAPGYRVRELTVTVRDSATGLPLPGVQAVLQPGTLQKATGRGGTFYIDDLPGGAYTLQLAQPGYAPATDSFTITDGQATVRNLVLAAL